MPLSSDKLGQYDRLNERAVMNNSTRERSSPLGCIPGRLTPRLDDRVMEVLGVRHYSEPVGNTEQAVRPALTDDEVTSHHCRRWTRYR